MSERLLGNNRWAMHWLGSMRRSKTPQEKKWRLSLGATDAEAESWGKLKAYVYDHPEIGNPTGEAFTSWAEYYSDPESAPLWVALWMRMPPRMCRIGNNA
jgi:hypothetical protein